MITCLTYNKTLIQFALRNIDYKQHFQKKMFILLGQGKYYKNSTM